MIPFAGPVNSCVARYVPRRAACLLVCAAVAALATLAGCKPRSGSSADSGKRPERDQAWNVLLISVDTTRADHLGCYGHPVIKTPNIDRLAAEGTLFTQCIASAPMTLPSHATMLTGSYQYVHGARDNGSFQLDGANETLAEILRGAEYTTHAEVSASVMNHPFGLDQGFETYGDMLNRDPFAGRTENPTDETPDTPAKKQLPAYVRRDAANITEAGLDLLRKHAKERFFIFLHYFDPHMPHTAPSRFTDRYTDGYLAEIAYFDEQFGRILDELRALELEKNTLVILTSDHGEGRGQHGESTHSFFIYDSTQHVPLILRAPGRIPARHAVLTQVGLIDIAPTVTGFLGLARTPQMQGVNLLDVIRQPALTQQRPIYADTFTPKFDFQYSPLRFIRCDGWKYIHSPAPELYHVSEDRFELFDLASAEPERVEKMRTQLYELIADSPEAPAGRASPRTMSDDERARLQALGYLGPSSSKTATAEMTGSELDQFEPVGANPRDRIEAIQMLSRAFGALTAGQFEAAEALYRKLIEVEPNNPRAHHELGDALGGLNRADEALAAYRRALELDPGNPTTRAAIATILTIKGDYEVAEKEFRDVLAEEPTKSGAHAGLANLLADQGRLEEAIVEYRIATELLPTAAELFWKWGMALRELKRLDEAEEKVRHALYLDPVLDPARVMLAEILWESERKREGIQELESMVERHAGDSSLLRRIAEWYLKLGDPASAERYFARVLEIDKDAPQAHFNLGLAVARKGDHPAAIPHFRKALELDPDYVRARAELAAALEHTGQIAEALAEYKRLTELAPQVPHAYLSVAAMHRAQGNAREVVAVLEEGLQKNPDDASLENDLAWQLATSADAAARDGERAVALAEKAAKTTSDADPGILDTLAAAYAEVGRFDDAVRTVKKAIALLQQAYGDAAVADMKQRLQLYEAGQPFHE